MRIILIALVVLLFTGCAASKMQQGVPISSVRSGGTPLGQTTRNIQVSKAKYDAAVARGGEVNSIRMVTVFRGPRDAGGGGNLPEYRLFDIRSQSVYDLLGIQSADVLVAAHGFIVYDPNSFPTYALSFISQVEKPSIEIKRAGVPMLLNYEFVP